MFQFPYNKELIEMEKRWKPTIEIAPNCPRCASSNTKFCYYNNYSLSQPRYFCKGCRRYWTKGGSLRNVPVGGGCRKSRRSKSIKLSMREHPSLSIHSRDSNGLSESCNRDSGSNIDLAVVFANFLNQNPKRVEPESDRIQVPDEAITITSDSAISSNIYGAQLGEVMEYESRTSFVDEEVDLVEGLIIPCQEEKIEQVNMGNEISDYGLQNLVGVDHHQVGEDVFWSDTTVAAATAMPSFTCQTTAHSLQELESFAPTNLVNDIWSSLDFSGFEVFSRS